MSDHKRSYSLQQLLENAEMLGKLAEEFTNEAVAQHERGGLPHIPTYTVWKDNITLEQHAAKSIDVLMLSNQGELLTKAFDALALKRLEAHTSDQNASEIVHGLIVESQKEAHALLDHITAQLTAEEISGVEFITRSMRLTRARELLDKAHQTLCPEQHLSAWSLAGQEKLANKYSGLGTMGLARN